MCSPAAFLASPREREPVPESFRENVPSSRTNGTAQEGRSEVRSPNRPAAKAEERKREGWSAKHPEIREILAGRPNCTSTITDFQEVR